MTREDFIEQLVKAGWYREEAEQEWYDIDKTDESLRKAFYTWAGTRTGMAPDHVELRCERWSDWRNMLDAFLAGCDHAKTTHDKNT